VGTASLRPLTILPQISTVPVRCTKLGKHFERNTAIMEVFYCFTVAIGLPGDASGYKDKKSTVATRIQNKVVIE